jgi:hypothetical protein
MKRSYIVLVLVALFVALSVAATKTSYNFTERSYHFTTYVENTPELIPAESASLWTMDTWLEEITLTNTSDAAVTVTVTDRQSTPRAVLSELSVDAHTTYVIRFSARYCPSGVAWSASSGTAVVGYVRGKR